VTILNGPLGEKKRKNNAGYAYRDWCNCKGFEVQMNYFKEDESSLPYITSEAEIDQLRARGCRARPLSFNHLVTDP
jgi:hypothetical protein